jgi:hypothetical protein
MADLTGGAVSMALANSPHHASVAGIRSAMFSLPATRGDELGVPVLGAAAIQDRVRKAWDIYDFDTARYDRLGPILPELIGHAHRTARTAASDQDALTAQRSLIETYHLLQVYLKRLGERDLARTAADRALTYATDLGDLTWTGASAWNLGAIMLNRGEGDLALDLARQTISIMTPIPDDASHEYVSVYGALHLVAAIACARSGRPAERGRGWDYLRQADAIARRLGHDGNDFRTSFGPTNVAMHAVHLAGDEEGNAAEALRLADEVDVDAVDGVLPLERRTRYLLAVMQAHRVAKDPLGTLYVLEEIKRISPEEIRHFGTARDAVSALMREAKPYYQAKVNALAKHMGVAA